MRDSDSAASRRWSWLLDSAILFLVAAALIWPVFKAEFLDAWASIESIFISDARFLAEHWPSPEWQPNWYCGTRFDYIYPPALRYGTAALSLLFNVSTARAYHLYTAFFYCVGIAGVYVFVRAGSASRFTAIWASVASATISPSFLLLEAFRNDYVGLYWMPLRLGVLIRYGEGPHMSAFALLPLGLAAAWYGLRRNHPARLAMAAILAALVVSNNFYGATALALFFPLLAWSVWLAEKDNSVWLRAVTIAVLAWGLTAFWLTPSYLEVTLRNMRLVSRPGHLWSAALGAVVVIAYAAVTWRLVRGRPQRAWAAFVAGAFTLMSLNVLGEQYYDFRVMGEPSRLVPELDFVILAGAALIFAWLSKRGRWWRAAAIALAVAALVPGKGYVRRCWQVLPPPDQFERRVEYRITEWMRSNLPDVRTFATGSVRFWYNTRHDMPQMGGGSDQGLMNLNTNVAYYQAAAGTNAEVGVAWLKAMGTGAVIVHDKTSEEIFHDFAAPEMYEGVLEKLYDDHAGNRIYRVPRRYPHLARVVDAQRLRALPAPVTEPDFGLISNYLDLVERGPDNPVDVRRIDIDTIRIKTRLAPGQAVLFQETYDPAWKASSNGRALPVSEDLLDFMVIEPGPGDHDILLRFETPLENRVGAGAFVVAVLAVVWLLVKSYRGRRL